jgi:serine protease Do
VISTPNGSGSGFFISPDGVVATNAHVVAGQDTATVTMSNGKPLQSSAIYADQERDLALIKVSSKDNPFLILQDLSAIGPGLEVIAIGSPGLGDVSLTNTVTKGVISGIRQSDHGVWVQTDASINPGNSGGPLLNHDGKVVGLSTMKIVAAGYSGLNFALASSELAILLKNRFNYSQADPMAPPSPVVSSPRVAVTIVSSPPGADIELDGTFVGSTPSELALEVGTKRIKLTKKGFTPYERTIQISTGSKLTIAADLEPAK